MPRPVVQRIQHYSGKLAKHIKSVATREESLGKAMSGAVRDTKKLGRHLVEKDTPHHRKKAIEYAKRGVKEYNAKKLKEAVYYFKHAVDADHTYARGYMYLGDAQYKREKLADAITAWQTVMALEEDSELGQMAQIKLNRATAGKESLSDLMEIAKGKVKQIRTK